MWKVVRLAAHHSDDGSVYTCQMTLADMIQQCNLTLNVTCTYSILSSLVHIAEFYNTIQYNNNICRALFSKRSGALTKTSDDMLCEIVQSLNGA